jgi:protease-4
MKRWQYILGVLLLIFLISFILSKVIDFGNIQQNEILIIPISGEIGNVDNNLLFSSSKISSDSITSSIKQARDNKNIKAIIFEINSPGGTVVASKEIADSVKKLNKPKVALIRDIGTSGAYWIASSSDKIVADPLSITGSIGVISSYLEFSDLLNNYGITYERLVSGKYKDIGNQFRNLTDEERKLLQDKLNKIDKIFLEEVKENRKLKDIKEIESGEFFLGIEAKELGLIDYLGNKETAVEVAKNLSNIKEAKLIEFKEKKSIFDVLSKLNANAFYYLGQGIGSQLDYEGKTKNLEINAI